MDKRKINKEQFKNFVLNEAKKFIETKDKSSLEENNQKPKRKITFDKVESLIKELEGMNNSISEIDIEDVSLENGIEIISEDSDSKISEKRSMNVNEHNKRKDFKHNSEGESDKWKRMLDYQIPKDEER